MYRLLITIFFLFLTACQEQAVIPSQLYDRGLDRPSVNVQRPIDLPMLKFMRQSGLTVEMMFKKVRNVVNETSSDQTPWESSSLQGEDFYFGGKTIVASTSDTPPVVPTPVNTGQNAEIARLKLENAEAKAEKERLARIKAERERKARIKRIEKLYTNLGIEYMRLGKYQIALQKLEKALKLNKYSANAHNVIAVLYQTLKVDDKARRHYQIAIELKPKDSDILNNYGQFLCQEGNRQEAEKHFLKALENPVYQKPEIPYTNAGLCALKHNHLSQAESYFRKALQKNTKFSRALYWMAKLSYKQSRYEQARNYLQRHDEIAKHRSKSLWLRVRVERRLGNKDAEASYALLLRHRFPDSKETQLLKRSAR